MCDPEECLFRPSEAFEELSSEDERVFEVVKQKYGAEWSERIPKSAFACFVRGYAAVTPFSQRLKDTLQNLDKYLKYYDKFQLQDVLHNTEASGSCEQMSEESKTEWKYSSAKTRELKAAIDNECAEHWRCYVYGVDSEGHPVIYDEVGSCRDVAAFKRAFDLDNSGVDKLLAFRFRFNTRVSRRKELLSKTERYAPTHCLRRHTVVMDMSGFSMSLLQGDFRSLVQTVVALEQSLFPDTLHRLFVVNARWQFRVGWKLVSAFVDPSTREKVTVLGAAFLSELTQTIPLQQIPAKYGGSGKWQIALGKDAQQSIVDAQIAEAAKHRRVQLLREKQEQVEVEDEKLDKVQRHVADEPFETGEKQGEENEDEKAIEILQTVGGTDTEKESDSDSESLVEAIQPVAATSTEPLLDDTPSLSKEQGSVGQVVAGKLTTAKTEISKEITQTAAVKRVQKSQMCRHRNGCVKNALVGFCVTLCGTFLSKLLLTAIGKLAKGRSLKQALVDAVFKASATGRFALSFALMSLTFRALVCILRRLSNANNSVITVVAAVLGALPIVLQPTATIKTYATVSMVRLLADVCSVLSARNALPVSVPCATEAAFICAQIPLVSSYLNNPSLIANSYLKWTLDLVRMAPVPSFTNSCAVLGQSGQQFALMYFVPPLMFATRKVLKNPTTYLKTKAFATMRSALFLTHYILAPRIMLSAAQSGRFPVDSALVQWLAAVFAGLSIFWEKAQLRSELALYFLPVAVEIAMRRVARDRWPRLYRAIRHRVFAIVNFQAAVAIWLVLCTSKERKLLNTVNANTLRFLFGSF